MSFHTKLLKCETVHNEEIVIMVEHVIYAVPISEGSTYGAGVIVGTLGNTLFIKGSLDEFTQGYLKAMGYEK